MTAEIAALADPLCRAELDRHAAAGGDAAELLRHLAAAGPGELDDLKLELGWSPPRMRRARAPLERAGAVVSQSITPPGARRRTRPFEHPSPLGPGLPGAVPRRRPRGADRRRRARRRGRTRGGRRAVVLMACRHRAGRAPRVRAAAGAARGRVGGRRLMGAGSTVVAARAGRAATAVFSAGTGLRRCSRGDDPAESWRGLREPAPAHRPVALEPARRGAAALAGALGRARFIASLANKGCCNGRRFGRGRTFAGLSAPLGALTLATSTGPVEAASVVVATGYTHTPVLPEAGPRAVRGPPAHWQYITGALRELRREATGIARAVQSR